MAGAGDRVYSKGPGRPRWTNLALRVADLEASIAWYERYTPLRVVRRLQDDIGTGVWLADPDDATPFMLVLSEFDPDLDPFGYAPRTVLGPYAHLGFELASREAVEEIAARAEADGILTYPCTRMPPPIGFICFVEDPDGNTVEFAFDQGTYTIWEEPWGEGP